MYIIFFAGAAAIVAATLYFYSRRRNTRRFLTTMRLSVLDRTVQQACRYIEAHFNDPKLSVEAVCAELVTGEAYLNRLFIKELGIDAKDFISQVRVEGIKYFLTENPQSNIDRVCVDCGFPNRIVADEVFVKHCGVSIEEFAGKSKNL